MTTQQNTPEQLNHIISDLNHRVTGSLARLEGLYRLYQQEGRLREDLWERAFGDAKSQLHEVLEQSFTLCARQAYGLRHNLTAIDCTTIDQAA